MQNINVYILISIHVFFFELIIIRASDRIPADFLYQLLCLKLNMIAVLLVQEEAIFYLLRLYYAAPDIVIY